MSKENVEIVRSSWEGLMKGDAAALEVFDRGVVYESDLLPENAGETYRGVDGMCPQGLVGQAEDVPTCP
jgi:hypothetical protein